MKRSELTDLIDRARVAGFDVGLGTEDRLTLPPEDLARLLDAPERIAQAIEIADGLRCPECGGKRASTRTVAYVERSRCGGGHLWDRCPSRVVNGARIAREHGKEQ